MIQTPQGELAAAYTFQPGAATRALELLGKHVGLFTDRLEVSGREGERLFGELSEEELIQRLLVKRAARAKVIAGQIEHKSLKLEWGSRAAAARTAGS